MSAHSHSAPVPLWTKDLEQAITAALPQGGSVIERVKANPVLTDNPSALGIAVSIDQSLKLAADSLRCPFAISVEEAAYRTGLSVSKLNKDRIEGNGPPWIKIGGKRVLYPVQELDSWLKSQMVQRTSEAVTRPDLKGKPPVGKGERRSAGLFD